MLPRLFGWTLHVQYVVLSGRALTASQIYYNARRFSHVGASWSLSAMHIASVAAAAAYRLAVVLWVYVAAKERLTWQGMGPSLPSGAAKFAQVT